MNIPGIRLIVPMLCGLLFLAVPSSNAKEPKPSPAPNPKKPDVIYGFAATPKASPTPNPKKPAVDYSFSAKPKASPTPKPNEATTINASKSNNFRLAASPTPKAK